MVSRHEATFTVGGAGKGRANVLFGEFRIVAKDFRAAHTRSEPSQHVRYNNTHPPNARSSTTLSRLNSDDLLCDYSSRLVRIN